MIKNLMMLCVAAMAAVCVHAVDGIYGPFVPGAAVDVDLGLVGYAAKKLPSGLKLDKKTGVVKGKAKKPGEYQVTFTKKGAESKKAVPFTPLFFSPSLKVKVTLSNSLVK